MARMRHLTTTDGMALHEEALQDLKVEIKQILLSVNGRLYSTWRAFIVVVT